MVFFAFLCIALGIWVEPLYAMLPFPVQYEPYTGAHVLTQLQLLLFSGLAFFVMLPYLKRTATITLDTDWVWRRLLPAIADGLSKGGSALLGGLALASRRAVAYLVDGVARVIGPHSRMARTWPTGTMALSMLVLLLGYLILYYV
jgi:multicomponent Na+:H+ antiporter subunit D